VREWFEDNFTYTQWIAVGDAYVEGYYTKEILWDNLKGMLFRALIIVVAAVVVLVRVASILYGSKQAREAIQNAGRMIEDYMKHDKEASEAFPQGYEEISLRLVEIKADMQRNAQMRLLRDNIVIYDGAIASLQRFKDSVKEVAAGYECGITFEKWQDIKEGDVIEAFLMEQIEVK